MSWLLETKEDKYRIFSTITEGYITKSLTKKELLRFMFGYKVHNLLKEQVQDIVGFPYGWYDSENHSPLDCSQEQHR